MLLDEFDYSKNYHFSGTFWFENEGNNRLSGVIDYTPEKGIRLSLLSTSIDGKYYLLFKDHCAIEKMYGAIQYKEQCVDITLLGVMLWEKSHRFGTSGSSKILIGNARYLLSNIHLKNNRIKSFNVEYDNWFKSIFFYRLEPEEISEVQPFIESCIEFSNMNISFDYFYMQTPLYKVDQLDDLLCDVYRSKKTSAMKKLKKLVKNFLEDHQHEIGIRKESRSVVKFKGRFSKIEKYIQEEQKWRLFFELILNHSISITKAWLEIENFTEEGKRYTSKRAILLHQYPLPTNNNNFYISKFHLPITIDSFQGKNNLFKLQDAYGKWNKLYADKKWKIVVDGIKSIIYERNLIGNEDFIILISYIETVLNILGYKENNIDQLVLQYADKKWKNEVSKLLKDLPKKETLGKKISEIRNSIAHPKSAKKENGKYFAITTDEILMQKIYGYLVGLFIKMILLYLYNFDETSLAKYIDRFIELRSGITKIKYDKDYTAYKNKLKKERQKLKKLPLSK